ncbi:hypothetical protein MASR2M36_24810 [Providencia sp.]
MANFEAFKTESQGVAADVLFINTNSSASEIYEAVDARVEAVRKINEELTHLANDKFLGNSLAEINAIMLADVSSLLCVLYGKIANFERECKSSEHKKSESKK